MIPPVRGPSIVWRASSASALVSIASLGMACLVGLACQSSPLEPSAQSSPSVGRPTVHNYGSPLGHSPLRPLSEVLAEPQRFAGQTVRVSGHVRRACSAKGCWMELATSSEAQAQACRVTFKDYAFFVPTDSAGAEAVVEGEVTVKRVRPPHVRHYEKEGASFPNKRDDGSAEEVRIVATGVELSR